MSSLYAFRTLRCIVHGVGNGVNVDPAAQVVGAEEAAQKVGVEMFISIPIDVDLELKEEVVTGDLGTLLRQRRVDPSRHS